MEKKSEKKELKILLGVLLTSIALAIIIAVVIVAAQSGSKKSVLWRGKYDYIDSFMIDGVFVAARDGEYFLVKEDRKISKNYSALSFNAQSRKYDYMTADGNRGELSAEGRELTRRKPAGVEISEKNASADGFYFTENNGMQTVVFGEQKLNLAAGERAYRHAEKGLSHLPLGTVLTGSASGDFITNMSGSPKFNLSLCKIHASGRFVTVAGEDGNKTYRLPELTRVAFLDGAEREEILTDPSHNPILYDYRGATEETHRISFLNGADVISYALPEAPAKALAVKDGRAFVSFSARESGEPERVGLCGHAEARTGLYRRLSDELFFIESGLYFFNNLSPVPISVANQAEVNALRADGKRYYLLDQTLYTLADDGAFTPVSGFSTGVTAREFEGKLYFISAGTLYGNRLNPIFTGAIEFAGDNLVKKSAGVYADFNGKTIDGIAAVHEVYSFADEPVAGVYLFETVQGAFRNIAGTVIAPAGFGTLQRVYQAATGGFVFKTDLGFGAGSKLLKRSAVEGTPELFGESGVAMAGNGKIETYQVTSRSEFSLTETQYYSNISVQCDELGLVFRDRSDSGGLYGYYSPAGKLISGPAYDKVTLTKNFVLAQTVNGLWRVFDRNGKRLLADRQIVSCDGHEYGGHLTATLSDGKTVMVSQNGAVVSEYVRYAFQMESFVTSAGDRIYESFPSLDIETDIRYTYEVFLFEDGMQILKIMN